MDVAVTKMWDVAIIGAGPAGFAAAMRAHDLGKSVALIERGDLGGAGVKAGALSSKTLWHLSNDFARAAKQDRGFCADRVSVSFDEVRSCVTEAVRERCEIWHAQLDALQAEGKFQVFSARARITSSSAVSLDSGEVIQASHILVATGSVPRVPEGWTVDGKVVVTSDQIEHGSAFPKRLLIVGAGVVGCEYATIFGNFGQSEIHLVDHKSRILPNEDEDVARHIESSFEKLKVVLHREARIKDIRVLGDEARVVIESKSGLQESAFDKVLVSIGRIPATAGIGLAECGVALDKHGNIIADGTRSSVPTIFAAGDVTADVALANIAELEGRHAIEDMFGENPRPIRYESLSTIMFLSPEVASIGLCEQQARERRIPYRVGYVSHRLISRNIAMRATDGFTKLLVSRDWPSKILGLRVVGPQASSAAQGIALLLEKNGTLEDIDACIHPHPSVPEAVQECARLLLGRSVHKPGILGPDLLRVGEG